MAKKTGAKKQLQIKDEHGWLSLGQAERQRVLAFGEDYKAFVSAAKTERACHDAGVRLAEAHGYRRLTAVAREGRRLKPGDRIYSGTAGKTLVLVHVGQQPAAAGLRIIGGHTDAPRLDLKPRPLYEDGGLAMLDTHYYGGIKKYQWVAKPLALHGVVVKKDGTRVHVTLGEAADDPVFTITDLLPHLGKDQDGRKLGEAFPGDALNVLCGSLPAKGKDGNTVKKNILHLLHERYGIDEADLTSAELELVPAGPARDRGFDRSMILAYGHDDRVCAYCALRAILDLKAVPARTAVCILCDKEEIGSTGATGMESHLFENTMAEVLALGGAADNDLKLRRCLRDSAMLSADVNVLHDPNYPEVSSPNNNMARLNYGVILSKYGGARGKSHSNDANAEYVAQLRQILDAAKVRWQVGELGKVDQGGGGTIAYMLARYGMDVIDCGVGLLSMHAPFEVAGKLDIYMAYKAYGAFYRAR